MQTTSLCDETIAKGVISSARQAWHDLFVWKNRVLVINNMGEYHSKWEAPDPLLNPFSLLSQLSTRNWVFFIVGFLAWTADAFDFHAFMIQTTKLAHYYDSSNAAITGAITLTLLPRSVGAALFGIASDSLGRKWPLAINIFVISLLQIATIYCRTLSELLVVRSLFGLFMGGIYGNAITMALDNCPTSARGFISGILQQGYALGYILAACANLVVGGGPHTFKIVFWIAAAFSLTVSLMVTFFIESPRLLASKASSQSSELTPMSLWKNLKRILTDQYKICLYCILLMTCFNFYAHTSQDSYTTFMEVSKGLDSAAASRAFIWMKVGAFVGGTIMGYISQVFGRRRTIIVACLASALMIPGWIMPSSEHSLSATGFLMQFFVQGAWGVIPVHLNELAPVEYRASFSGITYQIGNVLSSPSSQILNAIAERFYCNDTGGPHVPSYGPVMGISTAIIITSIVVTVSVGPERRSRKFEVEVFDCTEMSKSKERIPIQ